MEKKVGIVGLGKMGSALARTLHKHSYEVFAYDISEVKPGKGIQMMETYGELLSKEIPLLIAVKPAQVAGVLKAVNDNRLIISVAAGMPVRKLKSGRSPGCPVIRVMPNAPFLVNEGMSALFACEDCSDEYREFALEIFKCGGEAFFIKDEDMMHAITGLSGSGPAFVELFIQAMEDSGVLLGLPRDMARILAAQTVLGSARLVQRSDRSPQDLIHDVTSPGGTTISGLAVLKDFSFERSVIRAVRKAAEKSRQIAEE
ncbi:MAG: pyrroline-5-carboxylate reductase [Spirochaetia bacterium]|nr:pyrroline-5-carboxylate reductase [Spirochaetia bacterium]